VQSLVQGYSVDLGECGGGATGCNLVEPAPPNQAGAAAARAFIQRVLPHRGERELNMGESD
jgi:hypothetical protein